MAAGSSGSTGEPGESEKERIDRELIELLNGLRVALPGVQVLFAFLLTVPFAQGFSRATSFQRDVYLATLVTAALASLCFIAPAAQHRILFRSGGKEQLLRRANGYALAGHVCLGAAMIAAVLLIADVVFGRGLAVGLSTFVAALIIWAWLAQPLVARRRANAAAFASSTVTGR